MFIINFVLLISIIFASTLIIAQDTFMPNCNNCISVRMITRTGTDYDRAYIQQECSALTSTHDSTLSGAPAIIRSSQLRDHYLTITGGQRCNLGGDDATTEGSWRWQPTNELFFSGQSGGSMVTAQFSYAPWAANEPNEYGTGEDLLEMDETGTWNDITGSGRQRICCMFEHPRVAFLRTPASSTTEMDEYGIEPNFPIFEVQTFSEHATHATANTKCRALSRTDPLTGQSILGQLAILRSEKQSQTLFYHIFDNTDIKFHTTEADFGVWLGGTRTNAGAKTMGYTLGVESNTTDAFVAGTCDSFHYCNFTAAAVSVAWPATSSLAMQALSTDPTWRMLDSSWTMPFACSFEYASTSTINVSSILDLTLQNNLSSVEMFRAVLVGDHVTWEDARDQCGRITLSNSAGESVTGELGAIQSSESNAAVSALASAAYFDGRASSDEFGVWIGASTDLPTSGTTSSSCNLRWNGSSTATAADDDHPLLATCDGTTSACSTSTNGAFCNFSSSTLSSSWPVAQVRGVVVAIKRNPVEWLTQLATTPLPYVCTFRYTYRAKITDFLAAELHVVNPRSQTDAISFCPTRNLGVAGAKKAGHFPQTGYWRSGVIDFVSKNPSNDLPVWIGGKDPSDSTKCLAVYPRTGVEAYFDCNEPLPHVCLFQFDTTHTPSLTKSPSESESSTSTASTSSTLSESSTESLSESPTKTSTSSGTASNSPSNSEPTLSHSDTSAENNAVSLSHSLSSSSSTSESPQETKSRQLSVSNYTNSLTSTESNSIPLTEATNSSSHSFSNTSDISVSSSLTAATLTQTKETPTDNSSHSQEHTVSESLTILKVVIPVKAQPLSQAVATAATAIGMANPAVASSMARMAASKTLASCGTGTDLDDEPSRFESPFLWTIGTNELRWRRGIIAGVGVLMLMIIAANFLIGAGAGLVFLRDWKDGLLRMRFPSLVMLPFLIFHVPLSESVSIMFLYGAARDIPAACVGGTLLICLPVVFVVEVSRRIENGACTLVKNNPNSRERRATRRKWKKIFGSKIVHATEWLLMYSHEWRDADVMKWEKKMERRVKEGDKEAKRELKAFNKKKNHEFSRYPFLGSWGEVFDDVRIGWFFVVDFLVATIQGIAAGAAAKETTRTICFVSLTSALVACLVHTVVVFIKKPGLSRLFQSYLALSSVVTLAAFTLAFIKFILRDQFEYDIAAESVSMVQAALGMAISVVSLGEFFEFIHGLVASLCFSRKDDGDTTASDDEEDVFDKNNKDHELGIREEEEEMKEQAIPEEEEEEQMTEEEIFAQEAMANARQLLMNQARKQQNGDDDDDDDHLDDDDLSNLNHRERAFKLVRLLSTDDSTFENLKTPEQREREKKRKEKIEARIAKRRQKREEEEKEFRRKQIEDEAAMMMDIEKDVASFAASVNTTIGSPTTTTSINNNEEYDSSQTIHDENVEKESKNLNDDDQDAEFAEFEAFIKKLKKDENISDVDDERPSETSTTVAALGTSHQSSSSNHQQHNDLSSSSSSTVRNVDQDKNNNSNQNIMFSSAVFEKNHDLMADVMRDLEELENSASNKDTKSAAAPTSSSSSSSHNQEEISRTTNETETTMMTSRNENIELPKKLRERPKQLSGDERIRILTTRSGVRFRENFDSDHDDDTETGKTSSRQKQSKVTTTTKVEDLIHQQPVNPFLQQEHSSPQSPEMTKGMMGFEDL